MYVLDTNVVSELRKVRSGKANAGVAAITIHELEHGVLLMERSNPVEGAVLRAWLDHRSGRAKVGG
jgi:toxin FitB